MEQRLVDVVEHDVFMRLYATAGIGAGGFVV